MDLAALRDQSAEEQSELEARQHGLSYVKLDGRIGCMVNGAGLAMADDGCFHHFGGSRLTSWTLAGGASGQGSGCAPHFILSDTNVNAVLFNIFGGITRGDGWQRVSSRRPHR